MNPKSESIIDAQPQMVPNIEEYTRIKAQYPNHVVGVQNGDVIYFYGTEAEKAGPALDRNVLIRDIPGMSAVSITGDAESWQASREKLLRKGIDLAFTRLDDTGKYAELSFLCFLLNHFFLCFCQTNCQSFCSFSVILHTFPLPKVGPGYRPVFYARGGQPRALLAPAGGPYEPSLPGKFGLQALPQNWATNAPKRPSHGLVGKLPDYRHKTPTRACWGPHRGASAAGGGSC